MRTPGHSPCSRSFGIGFAYDSNRNQVVLFGGNGGGGIRHFDLGDTWAWDGSDWSIPWPHRSA